MRFRELEFLTDENISPKVVSFLREQGVNVLDIKEQGWQGITDEEALEIAHREGHWILTHDSDFGALALHEGKPHKGVVFLRLRNPQSRNVVKVCEQLLLCDIDFPEKSLVIVEEGRIRIRQVSAK